MTLEERASKTGHRAVTVWLDASPDLAHAVERLLFDSGCHVAVLTAESAGRLADTARALNSAGAIAICAVPGGPASEREQALALVGAARFISVDAASLPAGIAAAAAEVRQLLRAAGFLSTPPTA